MKNLFLIILSIAMLLSCDEESSNSSTSIPEEELVEEVTLLDELGECPNYCKEYTSFSKDSINTFFVDQKDSSLKQSILNPSDWDQLRNSIDLNSFFSYNQNELDTLFPPNDGLRSTITVKTNLRQKKLLFSSNTFLHNYRNEIIEIRSKYE